MTTDQLLSASDDDNADPSRGPKSYWGWYLALGLLMIAGLIGSQLISVPLHSSPETTFFTEPLAADGKRVDYFAALEREFYPANMATEENGYRLLFERLGPPAVTKSWEVEQACRKLGLDPAKLQPDLTCQEPREFLAGYLRRAEFTEADTRVLERLRATDAPESGAAATADDTLTFGVELDSDVETALTELLDAPWTYDDLPMMARWLEQNGAALDVVQEAVAKATFAIPMVRESTEQTEPGFFLPAWMQFRALARGLSARAWHRVGSGDVDGAIDDVIACQRLGRHIARGRAMVEALVGVAVEGIANSVGIAGSSSHPPTREQLLRLLHAQEDLPATPSPAEYLRFERGYALDFVQSLAHGKGAGSTSEILDELPVGLKRAIGVVGVNWNTVAHHLNLRYDALGRTGTAATAPKLGMKLLVSRTARSEFLSDAVAALALPSFEGVEGAFHRFHCGQHLRRISLAMLLYERDHGRLPPAWTVSADGTRLHSWRTLLLPYLGQQELYARIRLEEPWDSEYHRTLHEVAVPWYQCPSAGFAPGRTTYAVVVGERTAFDGTGAGRALDGLGEKDAAMILVIERQADVCWMDPYGEVEFEAARLGVNVAPAGVSSRHPGGANVGLRSGAVQFVSRFMGEDRDVTDLLEGTSGRGARLEQPSVAD